MGFSHFFVDRPIFAAVLSVILTLVGAISYRALPISEFPDIAPPTVEVTSTYPGASDAVTVRIPPGAGEGSRVRIPGHGAPSPNGGPQGDLVLVIHVSGHGDIAVDGPHLTRLVGVVFGGIVAVRAGDAAPYVPLFFRLATAACRTSLVNCCPASRNSKPGAAETTTSPAFTQRRICHRRSSAFG